MSKWVIALINGGKYEGKQVLSAATVREIQTPTMTAPAAVPLPYDENGYGNYGLGWSINSYRGHIRVEHGGNIDGFSASTCFMPRDSVGIIVLTNMNGSASTSVIRNYAIDKILNLAEVDWNGRLLSDVKKAREGAAKAQQTEDAGRVKDTKPSHPLTDYVGKFEHPAYGILTVRMEGDSLKADLHGLKFGLRHYHYDYFQTTGEDFGREKLNFTTNAKGEVEKVLVNLEPSVDEIVFTRKPDAPPLTEDAIAKYVGEYNLGGAIAKVYTAAGKGLLLFVPGQPEYELVPVKEHEFAIKSLKGFTIKFIPDSSGKAAEMLSIQPNGTFSAKRK